MMKTRRAILCLSPCLLLSGCLSTATPPQVAASLTAATHYVFRGVPQNEKGVLQADLGATLPTRGGHSLDVLIWGNLDLDDDTGDAALPDGKGGEFSELDIGAWYSRQLGGMAIAAGIFSYNFPKSALPSTAEAFATLAWSVLGFDPSVTFWYDFDELEGLYVNGMVTREWEVGERTSLALGATLGWTDENQAAYYFADESGFADLIGSATLRREIGGGASLVVRVHAATILDGDLRDALDAAGIASDNTWGGVGLAWSF